MSSIDYIPPIEKFGKFYDRDLNAISILGQILRTNEETFTILNKVGTHFPYKQNLPPDQADVADPYRTSVTRSSVGFLARLADTLPPGTLVFYTSDHGQNFHGKFFHCNLPTDSSVHEWMVPMLVLHSGDLQDVVSRLNDRWKDHASHAVLAETLRNILGYERLGAQSLFSNPDQDTRLHRAFYGPPKPFFGNTPFLLIDEKQGAFHTQAVSTPERHRAAVSFP